MKPRRLYFLLFVAVLGCSVLLGVADRALAVDLIVEENPTDPTHYSTIQSAIDYANTQLTSNPTGTLSYAVIVEPGTYSGGITLRSKIPVRGRETMRTIVNAGGSVAMAADNVTGVAVRNLTFVNAQNGIVVSNTSTVSITNNVFSVGTSGTAIQVSLSPSTTIVNNTFYQNGTAISRDADAAVITNNIFSNNQNDIVHTSFAAQNTITYNAFDHAPQAGEIVGTFYLPNTTYTDTNPHFVDIAATVRDFHLMANSTCIDTGDPARNDPYLIGTASSNPSDIGAYGGADADTIPAPVTGVTYTTTTSPPYSISLSWNAGANYLVGGYRVFYGAASKTYNGTDAKDGNGAATPSPVDALTATTLILTDLTATAAVSGAPVLSIPKPRNGALLVSWSEVPGTTNYTVHYGQTSTSEHALDAGTATSLIIPNLTNGQTYRIAVSAIAQSTYYIAVTAYDKSGQSRVPGVSHESAQTDEFAITVGPQSASGLSNEVTGMPELLVPYPALPNSGCFIATAAYGSADAAPVRVLRRFRDRFLLTTAGGRTFVHFYYAVSPRIAAFMHEHPLLKPLTRALLAPVVLLATAANASPLITATTLLLGCAAAGLFLLRWRRKRVGAGVSTLP